MSGVASFVPKHFKSRDVTFTSIVGAAVTFTEKNHVKKATTSENKLEFAKTLIPEIIDTCNALGWISDSERDNYKKQAESSVSLIEDIIELAVDISNNPNLVQAGQWIKNNKLCGF